MSSPPERTRKQRAERPRALLLVPIVVFGVVAYVSCSACGKSTPGGPTAAPGASASTPAAKETSRTNLPPDAGAAVVRDVAMWLSAKEGATEDLASLATHEGAAGLVEAAADPELRDTAMRAMAFARGWAQLPFLAAVAGAKDDAEAQLVLDVVLELAARPRRPVDMEDAEELQQGCDALAVLARDTARPRARRIAVIKALRMMPCPKQELPADLDAR